jgi:two-component system sensor kinase FixL
MADRSTPREDRQAAAAEADAVSPFPRLHVPLARAYAIALGSIVLAGLIRFALDPWLGQRGPLLVFTLPVLVTALYAGRGPAALVALISAGLGLAQFTREGRLTSNDLVYLIVYALVCVGIILLADRLLHARRRAFDQWRRAQSKAEELGLLVEAAADYALFMVDAKGDVTLWNKGAERIFGWSEGEIVGRSCALFYSPDQPAGSCEADLEEALSKGGLRREVWQTRKNGTRFLADIAITPLLGTDGRLRGFAKVLRDVTDRDEVKRVVERRERHLQSILDTVPDAMVVIDEKGKIMSFSAAAEQMFGYSEAEVVGENVSMLMPSPDRERHDGYLERYLRTGERRIIGIGRVTTARHRDGTTFPIDLHIGETRVGDERVFTGFIKDLTEREQTESRLHDLQSELAHVSRVTAMGTLATSLAHELNQPLTAIANYVETASDLLAQPDDENVAIVREALDDCAKQSVRAGQIVRRLRDFISRGETERRVESLTRLVNEASALALVGAGERGIEVEVRLGRADQPVLVDRIQIQQVLLNLIRNAIEAMSDCANRQLRISSRKEPDGFVKVTIADSGPGLPPAIAERLFEPFLSTKSEGMGLGLSICHTIISGHGGRIWAEPSALGGTAFHFTLIDAEGGSDEQ